MGWLFLYAGLSKLINPQWSALGYMKSTQILKGFYAILMSPEILPFINLLNEWSLTLLGISLILGLFVRLSSILGSVLMFLYYLPILNFPFVGKTSYIVDQHIIFILVLWYFAAIGAGRIFGLDNWCAKLPICKRFPKLRQFIG